MKKFSTKMLGIMVAFAFILCAIPALKSNAAMPTITGGYDTQASAYNWGAYEDLQTAFITLPAGQDEMWLKFTLPAQMHIFLRCSYSNMYEGMYLKLYSSTSTDVLETANSPENVKNSNTNLPFLALDCDNTTSSTQTYYIYVNRGSYQGSMSFNYILNNRIKKGNGRFSFSGTASNPGNSSLSSSGTNSSVLSLNLTNDTTIPPNAIVTSASTSGSLSPNQTGIHHMIFPSSSSKTWYTATVASSTSGSYDISASNTIKARQIWQFKYNATAGAKSTMRSVSMLLYWEYDIADTNYTAYSNK